MKKIYSKPITKVVELGMEDGILQVLSNETGTAGGGNEEGDGTDFGVKGKRRLWDDDEW